MMFYSRISLALTFCFAVIFSGCIIVPPRAPSDLKFTSINSARVGDVPEKAFRSYALGKGDFYRVNFSSERNILDFTENWGSSFVTACSCDDWNHMLEYRKESRKGATSLRAPNIFDASTVYLGKIDLLKGGYAPYEGSWVKQSRAEFALAARSEDFRSPFQYYLYLQSEQIDLAEAAAHGGICIQLTSAEFLRFGAQSNILRVPPESLESLRK
jgi:hypothetical protein